MSVGKHLLLVEDDEVFSHVISRSLRQRGYEVTTANSVDTARKFFHPEVIPTAQEAIGKNLDYAILDLNLDGEPSLPLIPELRACFPAIEILMLTGYASIATAVEAIKLGANNYLAKPADVDEILSALLATVDSELDAPDNALSIEQEFKIEPMSVRRLEWEHIQKVLQENNGNISATARKLKMHRRTLQRKLQKRPVAK